MVALPVESALVEVAEEEPVIAGLLVIEAMVEVLPATTEFLTDEVVEKQDYLSWQVCQ